jgi:nitrogen fixation protein FixH
VVALAVLPTILIVVAALLIVLFVGGVIANARRRAALRERLHAEIEAADEALAAARAEDRGWDKATMEGAAREALVARHAGGAIRELHLVQVVDRPGTDADQAVFRVHLADGREESLTLGRRDGAWVAL